jgi:hypothetical protein
MFLSDIAEFENAYARYKKEQYRKLKENNDLRYSPGFDPNVWEKQSRLQRRGIATDNRGNILPEGEGFILSEKQIRRNIDAGTRATLKRDKQFKPGQDSYAGNNLRSKQERLSRLSPESREKIRQRKYPEQQVDWDTPVRQVDVTKPKRARRINRTKPPTPPKQQLLLAPAKSIPTPTPVPKSIPITNVAKKSNKFLNKYSLGAVGLLGAGAATYGASKLFNHDRDKQRKGY